MSRHPRAGPLVRKARGQAAHPHPLVEPLAVAAGGGVGELDGYRSYRMEVTSNPCQGSCLWQQLDGYQTLDGATSSTDPPLFPQWVG